MEIKVKIQTKADNTKNHIELYAFRLNSKLLGNFGQPLLVTAEILPSISDEQNEKLKQKYLEKSSAEELKQDEENFKELMRSDFEDLRKSTRETNPILYQMAFDFQDEGLGTFEDCLEVLQACMSDYDAARKQLEERNQ